MEKILAVVGRVDKLSPIPEADKIVSAEVICGDCGRWTGVVPNTITRGQKVIVFLQDALLPEDERWSFMANRGWRVRMARFRGAPSECLIIQGEEADRSEVGTDLTEQLGVKKYEKSLAASLGGIAKGFFPSFIPKTDEDNFQASNYVPRMAVDEYYITEKADGTSCTVWNDQDGFHVCSRNLELKEETDSGKSNVYWEASKKYDLERIPGGIALQFEVVGDSIQKNRMGISGREIRVFLGWDIENRKYITYPELKAFCLDFDLPMARCIGEFKPNGWLPTSEALRGMAEITYQNGKAAEGIVIRNIDSTWSFKVINLLYKD